MQCLVSDPEQPDVISAGVLRSQVLRCRPKVVGDGPTPTVNIDGDILPVVIHLDLRTDVPSGISRRRVGRSHPAAGLEASCPPPSAWGAEMSASLIRSLF